MYVRSYIRTVYAHMVGRLGIHTSYFTSHIRTYIGGLKGGQNVVVDLSGGTATGCYILKTLKSLDFEHMFI